MSLLLDYHSSTSSAPPPYALAPGAPNSPISLPANSISDLPHRYYPMPRRMESNEANEDGSSVPDMATEERLTGHTNTALGVPQVNSNSLFSPASVITDLSSMDYSTPASYVPGLTPEEEQEEAQLPAVELSESNISGAGLPEYSTGAQITRAPTEPEQSTLSRLNQHLHPHHNNSTADDDRLTSALTIRIDRTRFSLGDIIQGTIMFVPWRKKDSDQPQGISGVNLLLLVKESTFSSLGSNANISCSHTYKLGYHIVPEMAMPPDGTVSTGYIYSFPFSVQVPNVKMSPDEACTCGAHAEHMRLGPSFSRPGVKVEYQLCATVRGPQVSALTSESRIVTLCRSVRDLEIVSSYPPLAGDSPGHSSSDSDAATRVHSAQANLKFGGTLKTLWSSSKKATAAANGQLSIQLTMPNSSTGGGLRLALDRAYSMLLPLELDFAGTGTPSVQRTSLELRSTTTYLASRKVATLDQARAAPKLAAAAIKTVTETLVLAQHEMNADWQQGESGHKTCTVSIPLAWDPEVLSQSSAPGGPALAASGPAAPGASTTAAVSPSFKSCVVEHQHELELKVFVSGGTGLKKQVCVGLKVPLEVVATA